MTEQTPTKTCNACRKNLPATVEFFFPSYLEPGGKNICKTCHRERAKKSHSASYRIQLRGRATPISSEQIPLYKSLSSIATTLNLSVGVVEHDIFDRNLHVYTFTYNKVGPALALQMEDAEAYIREHMQDEQMEAVETPIRGDAQNGHMSAVISKKPEVMGSTDTCGCCKNDKGNILAVRNMDQQTVAYLCSTCYRAAKSFDWEPERLRAVAKLIETIGGNIDRSRR
jgi:hypothetical protein